MQVLEVLCSFSLECLPSCVFIAKSSVSFRAHCLFQEAFQNCSSVRDLSLSYSPVASRVRTEPETGQDRMPCATGVLPSQLDCKFFVSSWGPGLLIFCFSGCRI